MCKFFPDIKLVQKQDFELGKKELLRSRQVRRGVVGCTEGEPSEEFGAENYCICHLYMRKIVENHDYLDGRESEALK